MSNIADPFSKPPSRGRTAALPLQRETHPTPQVEARHGDSEDGKPAGDLHRRLRKMYLGIRPSEVEAIRFVTEHTSIPVPHIYDVGERHFTMRFIEGETLAEAWKSLSADDKTLIVRQLRVYVGQLRAIKSPDGLICSVGDQPAVNARRYYTFEGGPFTTEAAFNDFLVSDLIGHSKTRDMIRSQMRDDHEIVFSHGDLHDINIIVRPGGGVVAIIDWELAGFYPEYLDLLKPLRLPDWTCSYYDELTNIFPRSYEAEYVVDQVLTHLSKH